MNRMGRWPKQPDLTTQAARRIAENTVVSPAVRAVLENLRCAGALTAGQIRRQSGISVRYLRQLHQRAIISRIRIDLETQLKIADRLGFSREDAITYCLGPVGIELVRSADPDFQAPAYTALATGRVIHDVLTAETVIRLADGFRVAGWQPEWVPRYKAAILERGHPELDPDALIVLTCGEAQAMFALEFYSDVVSKVQAEERVKLYEAAYREGRWREAWGTDEMPFVLIGFSVPLVGKNFNEAIIRRGSGMRVEFFGKLWEKEHFQPDRVLKGWFDFRAGRNISLLDLIEGEEEESHVMWM